MLFSFVPHSDTIRLGPLKGLLKLTRCRTLRTLKPDLVRHFRNYRRYNDTVKCHFDWFKYTANCEWKGKTNLRITKPDLRFIRPLPLLPEHRPEFEALRCFGLVPLAIAAILAYCWYMVSWGFRLYICSVLAISYLGADHHFWVKTRFGILVESSFIWANQVWPRAILAPKNDKNKKCSD